MKKLLIGILKVGLSVAIVVWLLWDALNKDPEAFVNLRAGAKDWWVLSAALAACAAAVVIVTVRWYYLVRALGIHCRIRDIFRISMVGYLFNLAPMGIVGGDLLKAWLLAREQHGHRAESLASVVVDRVIGLYMLFVVSSTAILATGFLNNSNADVRYIARAALTITAVGTVAVIALLAPEATAGRVVRWFGKIPYVGPPLERLIVAVRLYRHKLPVLLAAALMTIAVHSLFAVGIHCLAVGLPGASLSLSQHFVVGPLSNATSVIPLPAGPQEGAMQFLYNALADAPLKGLVIALGYRIITVLIAAVGMVYYLASRREVAEVLQEADEAQLQPPAQAGQPVG